MTAVDAEAALREAARAVDRLIDSEAAQHEASHVTTAWALGVTVEQATINGTPPHGGHARLAAGLPPDALAVVALAGAVVAGQGSSDELLAIELAGEAGLGAARARACAIVAEHRDAIELVAGALIDRRTIDRDELEEIRRRMFPDIIVDAA